MAALDPATNEHDTLVQGHVKTSNNAPKATVSNLRGAGTHARKEPRRCRRPRNARGASLTRERPAWQRGAKAFRSRPLNPFRQRRRTRPAALAGSVSDQIESLRCVAPLTAARRTVKLKSTKKAAIHSARGRSSQMKADVEVNLNAGNMCAWGASAARSPSILDQLAPEWRN